MSKNVTISNGEDFYVIPLADLEDARADGFYVPAERQMTIVSDGTELFEIPIDDVAEAATDGFQDLLVEERTSGFAATDNLISTGEVEVVDGYVTISTGVDEEVVSTDEVVIETDDEVEDAEVDAEEIEVDTTDEEAELLRQQRELELEEAGDFQRLWLQLKYMLPDEEEQKRLAKIYGVTAVVHLVVLIIFGLYKLALPAMYEEVPIISTKSVGAKEVEIIEPDEVVVTEEESSSDSRKTENLQINAVATTDFNSSVGALSGGAGEKGFGTSLDGLSSGAGVETSFFGAKTVASTFVFVVDNSNSMGNGRFETALNELQKTVDAMKPSQSFYVIFYSDTAYPLFYPETVQKLQPATPANKQKLRYWLSKIPMCLKTNCREAMQLALSLKPEVVYILGDGAFTDNTAGLLASNKQPMPINTLGMQVKGSAEEQFKLIATVNGGTYNDVGVDPKMAELAKRMPRPKLNKRSGVWGITLK